ncbi:MAG: aromatic acid exporter family protein [Oscillospiraceae bacterium]
MKKWKELLFGGAKKPWRFHIGLRMVKTALAVYICVMIGYLRGQPTIFSAIAAVLCMQNTTEKTLISSFDRVLGTLIGGVFGILVLFAAQLTDAASVLPLYYLLVAVMILPVIIVTLALGKPSISGFSCVVFLSATIYHIGDASPITYALNRILDTGVGIAVALLINLTIPNVHAKKAAKQPEPPPENK